MCNYEDFVEEVPIKSYNQLIRILHRSIPNFRENYIFRGLGSVNHELIPSALRNDTNKKSIIDNYVDSKFWVIWAKTSEEYYNEGKISKEQYEESEKDSLEFLGSDKNGDVCTYDGLNRIIHSENEFHFKKELYILLRFLNWTDRSGLKITTTPEIRRLLHENLNYRPKDDEDWPHQDFLEIISLAQHYTLPTEALDWSYDFNVSLYFSVQNILENNEDDCILWALNYKLFEENYVPDFKFPYKLQFYRPEYNTNPNLRAQKGLFTFITHKFNELDYRALDEIVVEDFMKNVVEESEEEMLINIPSLGIFSYFKNEKLFYKFIIPGKLKHIILKELYLNGYSEEYLFPGYSGVVFAIENKVKLDNYVANSNKPPKMNLLMSFSEYEIDKLFIEKKKAIFKKSIFYDEIDKIFIYSKDSQLILGYFKCGGITKRHPQNLWYIFNKESVIEEKEFLNYFKNKNEGFAIKVVDLIKFEFPIEISDFEFNSEFYFIHPKDKKLNFLLNFEDS